ncbi:hypothetical protein HDU88_007291 [Geranomyces variabilis]|nr:hypothetical protein HDU88_007291 [Geranomyces variabilis]
MHVYIALRFFALVAWAGVTCAQIAVSGFASSIGIPFSTSTDDSYEYIPIQDSYRVALVFQALTPAGTITFTSSDENNAVVSTSTETVTALVQGVFNTPTLPAPSSWPANRTLGVTHSSGISTTKSIWLYALSSGSISLYALPSLISAKIGTGAWVSVLSHRYLSPPFIVAPGATVDFAIGNLVTRTNPVALGTTSAQTPTISITNVDTQTLVPSSLSVTPAGAGYYTFSWTIPASGRLDRRAVGDQVCDDQPGGLIATETTAANTFLVGSPAVTSVWTVAMTSLSATNPTKATDNLIQPQFYRGQAAQIRWTDSTSSSQTDSAKSARQALAAGVTVTLRGLTSNVAYAVAASAWSYVNTDDGLVFTGNFTVECGYSSGLYRLSAYYIGAPRFSASPLEPKTYGRYSVDFPGPIEIVANAPAGPICTSADAAEGSAATIPNDGYVLPFSAGFKTRAVSHPVIALSMLAAIACALF